MDKLWKVGDLAKLTGLTIRTLRYYDQIGLFSPSGQTASGHRLYHAADLTRLHQIVALKELGLPLEEIKSAIAGAGMSPLAVIALQKERVKEQIKRQQRLLEQLEHLSKRLQGQTRLSVEECMNLLHAMKSDYDKLVVQRQSGWERQLDLLSGFLAGESANPILEEE